MMMLEALLLVFLGGLFGWLLGKLPDRWVYVVALIAVALALVVVKG